MVIIGSGFGGLYTAHHLKNWPVDVTIIDKRNFHLFQPLPGVAPVAMQQGQYVAALIRNRLGGQASHLPFFYFDKGSLAVIGRNAAVASVGPLKISGFLAWISIHIWYLIGFGNKEVVMFQWAWNYLTWQRSARLITGKDPFPLVNSLPEPSQCKKRRGFSPAFLFARQAAFLPGDVRPQIPHGRCRW